MSRPLRLLIENGTYHIMCRGNRREDIFTCDSDKRNFLRKMDEAFKKYSIICFAFCLMNNHYHLMVQTPLANISEGIHALNSSYSNWFRTKYKLIGSLFQGRFKSIVIDTDAYAMQLSAYIHLNPLRAGLVTQPEYYQWSSFRDYIGLRNNAAACLDVSFILIQISQDSTIAQAKYRQFVHENASMNDPCKNAYKGIALGNEPFLKKINAMIEGIGYQREISITRKVSPLTPDDIVGAISAISGESIEKVIVRKRGNVLRQMAILLSKDMTPLNLRELGDYFEMDYAAVSQAASRFAGKLNEDAQLRLLKGNVEKQLSREMSNVET